MQTKLTLRLDDELIKRAKDHARRSGRSLSQLVADLFRLLGTRNRARPTLSPKVAALKGALKGAKVSVEDYKKHLEGKHA